MGTSTTQATDWTSILGPLLGGYLGYRAGGDQTNTTQVQMDPDMKQQWLAYQNFANQVANRPYQPGVAPFSQDQYAAMDMIRNAAGGTPETQAGSQALQAFLSGGMQNPYQVYSGGGPSSATAGMNQYLGNNPFLSGGVQNPYQMSNPYLQGMMQSTGDQIQNRMNSSGFGSGSFGNSGVAYSGAKALADSANQLQYQDFSNQAGLAENALNRTAGAYQQLGSLGDADAARQTQTSMTNAQLAEQAAQRYMQSSYQQAMLGENSLNRMMTAIPQALAYGQLPYQNASALMQSGAQQQYLGQQYLNDYLKYPQQQLTYMGMPLGFDAGKTTTTSVPGNEWASALGGGLLGYQFGSFKG